MAQFDQTKAYVARPEVFFDDGREIELLQHIYGRPDIEAIRGSPSKLLAAMDEYGRTKNYLMNVGEDKGKIVTNLIEQIKPKIMVECGGYTGYSCVLFADAVKRSGGQRYYSLERHPVFGAIIMSFADLAGLSDIVKVIVGPSDASIKRLHSAGDLKHIDLMFLDHYKPAYTSDLKLCEELRLIKPGSVLAADNVIYPGNPPYLEYVRSSVEQKRIAAQHDDPRGIDPRFAPRALTQYTEKLELSSSRGNPNLVYDSNLTNSFEPTGDPDGVEISRCVREEQ